MKPFKVECINTNHNPDNSHDLIHGHHYTVVEVDAFGETVFYYLAETERDYWFSDRFVKVEETSEPKREWRIDQFFPEDKTSDQPFHLVMEGIHDLNTATNLVAALTKKFSVCHFDIQNYYRAESGNEYIVVENPPSVSSSRRKYMKLFATGFLAALP
jgi:hypothetical protein